MKTDYNDETFINELVDQYQEKGTEELKLSILNAFDPYFNKYVYLLGTQKAVDFSNKDTLTFLRLFMSDEDRADDTSILSAAKRVVGYVRGVFNDCTAEDIYDEMVCIFLEQLGRYKPMIANNTPHKSRISFTHFLQVNTRYRMKTLATERAKDALHSLRTVEYNDELCGASVDSEAGTNWSNIDFRWVYGDTSGELFEQLEEYERYLLYLKYENGDDKALSDYDLARITGQERMYIRRKMLKIREKLKLLTAIGSDQQI